MFAEASHSDAGPVLLLNVWKSFPKNFGVKQTSKLGKNQIKIIEENSPGTIDSNFIIIQNEWSTIKLKILSEQIKNTSKWILHQISKILKNCLQVNSSF